MDHQRVSFLYNLYLAKNMNPQELEEFKQVILDPEQEIVLQNQIEDHWSQIKENTIQNLSQDKMDEVFHKIIEHSAPSAAKARLLPRIIIAAAMIVIVFGAGLFYLNRTNQIGRDKIASINDVKPGTTGATLTLANGKKIKLSDAVNGEIAQEAGISVTKTADGQLVYQIKETVDNADKMNTLSTAKGETYILNLPDKSKVWLNAASSLTYSATLNEHGVRRVKLKGEAYFEIFKDKTHPFIVETSKQQVEVLGTHFNINSYADETATTTTLLEGSVKVTMGNLKRILEPGQQALNRDGSIDVTTADVENVIDWKNGDFFLDRVDFRTAMRKICRWYDVEVIYDASVPMDIESSGYISRTRELSSVLKLIERSGQVHFRIDGRRIYVSK